MAAVEQPSEKRENWDGCSQEQLKKEFQGGREACETGQLPKRGIKKENRLGSYEVAAKDLRPSGDFGHQQPPH